MTRENVAHAVTPGELHPTEIEPLTESSVAHVATCDLVGRRHSYSNLDAIRDRLAVAAHLSRSGQGSKN
jgi:hypothetical protein